MHTAATHTAKHRAATALLRAIETSSAMERGDLAIQAIDAILEAVQETDHGRAVREMIAGHGNLGRLHDGDPTPGAPRTAEELQAIAKDPDPRD